MAINIKNYEPALMAGADVGVGAGTAVQVRNNGTTVALIGDFAAATLTAAGAATVNGQRATLTTPNLYLTTASTVTYNVTNTFITPSNLVFAGIMGGSFTVGLPAVGNVVAGTGSCTIQVYNATTTALDGNVKIGVFVA